MEGPRFKIYYRLRFWSTIYDLKRKRNNKFNWCCTCCVYSWYTYCPHSYLYLQKLQHKPLQFHIKEHWSLHSLSISIDHGTAKSSSLALLARLIKYGLAASEIWWAWGLSDQILIVVYYTFFKSNFPQLGNIRLWSRSILPYTKHDWVIVTNKVITLCIVSWMSSSFPIRITV